MTGGINYWSPYTEADTHDICDTSVKIEGDAAVSAHKWADYFWRYSFNFDATEKALLNTVTDTFKIKLQQTRPPRTGSQI